MTDDTDWIALSNHLANRATPAERAKIERWVQEGREHERLMRGLGEVWAQSAEVKTPIGEVDVNAAWRVVERRVGEGGCSPDRSTAALSVSPVRRQWRGWRERAREPRWRRRGAAWMLRAAAAAIVVGGVGALLETSKHAEPPLVVREIRTERGQRAELRLGDGSRVVLGPDSRVRWPASFVGRARDVSLEGEALFEVARDRRHPFRVHTLDGMAEDVGTQFVVRAYRGEARTLVAVKEGAVTIVSARDASSQRSTLRAGDLGLIAQTGRTTIERGIDIDHYLAFASGRLVFQRTPMRDVVAEMERWYDVCVVLADSSLGGVLVNASFRGEGPRDVVAALTTTLGARAVWSGRTVTLYARP